MTERLNSPREFARQRLTEAKKKIAGNLCVNTGQGSGGGFSACSATGGSGGAPAEREKFSDGMLVPKIGDEVFTYTQGFGGTKATINGVVVKGSKGEPRVRITHGSDPIMGKTAVKGSGRTHPLDRSWAVKGDPELARREAVRAKALADKIAKEKADKDALSAIGAAARKLAIEKQGFKPFDAKAVEPGDIVRSFRDGNTHPQTWIVAPKHAWGGTPDKPVVTGYVKGSSHPGTMGKDSGLVMKKGTIRPLAGQKAGHDFHVSNHEPGQWAVTFTHDPHAGTWTRTEFTPWNKNEPKRVKTLTHAEASVEIARVQADRMLKSGWRPIPKLESKVDPRGFVLAETKKKIAGNLCLNVGQGSGGGFTACNTAGGSAPDENGPERDAEKGNHAEFVGKMLAAHGGDKEKTAQFLAKTGRVPIGTARQYVAKNSTETFLDSDGKPLKVKPGHGFHWQGPDESSGSLIPRKDGKWDSTYSYHPDLPDEKAVLDHRAALTKIASYTGQKASRDVHAEWFPTEATKAAKFKSGVGKTFTLKTETGITVHMQPRKDGKVDTWSVYPKAGGPVKTKVSTMTADEARLWWQEVRSMKGTQRLEAFLRAGSSGAPTAGAKAARDMVDRLERIESMIEHPGRFIRTVREARGVPCCAKCAETGGSCGGSKSKKHPTVRMETATGARG